MDIAELISLAGTPPEPWKEGRTIPWDDPGFSRRMLQAHLSPLHDAASRRPEVIDRHVALIERVALPAQDGRVLDLGCGPGLYLHRLAEHGHSGVGIDFGPASIDYARQESKSDSLRFELGDIRDVAFGQSFDLVMLLFGELNLFPRDEAVTLLRRCSEALAPGGHVLLEVHSFDKVRSVGTAPPTWRVFETGGLFSDDPHLRLDQSFWLEETSYAVGRHWIVDSATAAVTRYGWTMKAYLPPEYEALLREAGLRVGQRFGSMTGDEAESEFPVLLAQPA